MGQVSLPVLSRKGKYDHWNNNWTSFKNYSLVFNEDLFIKQFFFLFFMYGISHSKNFNSIFFKRNLLKNKLKTIEMYNLNEFTTESINHYFLKAPHNKFYISRVFLCRYINWLYVYLIIYSVTNIRTKLLKTKKKITYFNKQLFYQSYLLAKHKYTIK